MGVQRKGLRDPHQLASRAQPTSWAGKTCKSSRHAAAYAVAWLSSGASYPFSKAFLEVPILFLRDSNRFFKGFLSFFKGLSFFKRSFLRDSCPF